MRVVCICIPEPIKSPREDTVITIPPEPSIKDLVREEMRIHRNEEMDKRITEIFTTTIELVGLAIAGYYLSTYE